jgi:leader peptidase (prepilin peptidase) / N-methyltransferase
MYIMLESLPSFYIPLVASLWGVVIGSFLNVYIYRFHTGKSIAGSSHCMSCKTPLRWYELFPLVSYLGLRGRCRTCRAHIPSRYFWVELVTALSFLLVVTTVPDMWLWPLLAFLMATLVVISVYDLYHFVIPDVFVLTLCVIAVIYGGYELYLTSSGIDILERVGAAAIGFGFFAGLWTYSKGRWIGFGDAKLAVPLAFMVGLGGVFSMLVLSFWIGTIISLGIIVFQTVKKRGQLPLQVRGRGLTIKSEVPFAPFLILGFVCVFFWQIDVLALFTYAFF